MKTYQPSAREIPRRWLLFDARDQVLGRLAVKIVRALMGKDQPRQVFHLESGHFVVVINAGKIKVTGGKEKKKFYYRYSGYPGGLKKETYKQLLQRAPEKILRHAVLGMLPSNKLRAVRLRHLFIYLGEDFPQKGKIKFSVEAKKE